MVRRRRIEGEKVDAEIGELSKGRKRRGNKKISTTVVITTSMPTTTTTSSTNTATTVASVGLGAVTGEAPCGVHVSTVRATKGTQSPSVDSNDKKYDATGITTTCLHHPRFLRYVSSTRDIRNAPSPLPPAPPPMTTVERGISCTFQRETHISTKRPPALPRSSLTQTQALGRRGRREKRREQREREKREAYERRCPYGSQIRDDEGESRCNAMFEFLMQRAEEEEKQVGKLCIEEKRRWGYI